MTARGLNIRAPALFSALLGGLCLWAGVTRQLNAGVDASIGGDLPPLRLAISERLVRGVNLSDASAAMAVWASELLQSAGLKLALLPSQGWVMPSEQLLAAIRGGNVDVFCFTMAEYRQVAPYVDTAHIITDALEGEEFLLVVREGSGIVNLAGLWGRSLIFQDSSSTSLAEPWLTVSLWREGLDSPEQLLGHISRNAKLSQVVLPLFFGQADACVVTRRALDTMIELNPQVARRVKVLMASPKMEGSFFAFRKDYPARFKRPVYDRILSLKRTPTTQQVFTLFQATGFTGRTADCLSSANSLLDEYERHHEPGGGRKR